jgi:hypothetical protein
MGHGRIKASPVPLFAINTVILTIIKGVSTQAMSDYYWHICSLSRKFPIGIPGHVSLVVMTPLGSVYHSLGHQAKVMQFLAAHPMVSGSGAGSDKLSKVGHVLDP